MLAWSAAALTLAFAVSWPLLGREWASFGHVLATIASGAPGAGSNIGYASTTLTEAVGSA